MSFHKSVCINCGEPYLSNQLAFQCEVCGTLYCIECEKKEDDGFKIENEPKIKLTSCVSCCKGRKKSPHQKKIIGQIVNTLIENHIDMAKSRCLAVKLFDALEPVIIKDE